MVRIVSDFSTFPDGLPLGLASGSRFYVGVAATSSWTLISGVLDE